jgi:hypothetical protein
MKKLSIYTFVIVVSLGATAMLATGSRTPARVQASEAQFAADGAFRDGLYFGRIAAEQGQPMRPSIGRWSTAHDHSTFSAGYRRGYGESAPVEANAEQAQPTD